jgi:hypothetical protein
MFEPGFFYNNPQEFFASISNQWFTDGWKTIELGLVRFDNGYLHPINQALFILDVYSLYSDSSSFYAIDVAGNLVHDWHHISRDAEGNIIAIFGDTSIYNFSFDSNGDVISYWISEYSIADKNPCRTPLKTQILENHPNPFNISTIIRFELIDAGDVELKIYDLNGGEISKFEIRNSNVGESKVVWEPKGLPSGIYFAELQVGGFRQMRKLLLLK